MRDGAAQEREELFAIPSAVFFAVRFVIAEILRKPLIGLPRRGMPDIGAPQGDQMPFAV